MEPEVTLTYNPNTPLEPEPHPTPPKRTKLVITLSLLFVFIIAAGAYAYWSMQNNTVPEQPATFSPTSIPTSPMTTRPPISLVPPSPEELSKLSEAQNTFGVTLFKEVINDYTTENVVISPLSIHMALSIAYNGAREQTKEEMKQALTVDQLSDEELNQLSQYMISTYNKKSDITLGLANSLWVANENAGNPVQLNSLLQSVATTNYQAELQTFDYKDDNALPTINGWISDKTYGKITDMIKGPLKPLDRLFIINALYFKAPWLDPFEEEATEDRIFTNVQNNPQFVPSMSTTGSFDYYEDTQVQAVSLPYSGYLFDMTILLPKNNYQTFLNNFSLSQWNVLKEKSESRRVHLFLPKFKSEIATTINNPLKRMGMQLAFDDKEADFTGILDPASITPGQVLYISQVLHNTFINVDENGTEAAAATVIRMPVSGGGSFEEPTTMDVNRPFFFVISDTTTGNILFIGTIRDIPQQ